MSPSFWKRWVIVATSLVVGACASTQVERMDEVTELKRDEAAIWQESEKAAAGIIRSLATDDQNLQVYVESVLERLVAASTTLAPDRRPKITVLDDVVANAAAMPHGDLFITHGMLAQINNEAQLAFVLGHEIVHYRRRHALISQRFARNQRTKSVLVGVALTAMSGVPITNDNESAWQLALNSGYSRELETESDLAALEIMAASGYDIREAVPALEKLRRDRSGVRNPLFASHPDIDTRVETVQAQLEILAPSVSNETNEPRYAKATDHLIVPQTLALIDNGELTMATAMLHRYLHKYPGNPEALFAFGESIRATSSSRETSIEAAEYYQQAVDGGNAPAAAYRELGLHYRLMAESAKADQFFREYLKLAPDAIDAPLIETYLREEP
ncbi:MAG: M48 family metallopeptidase [Pseudomonadota bacterium]